MFIREAIRTKKGKKYTQHQLVESVRTPKGPRQKLILNLGKINLPKEQWKSLANTIESELHGYENLFHEDPEIKALATYYTKLIRQQRLNKQAEIVEEATKKPEPTYENVDISTVSTSDNRTLGAEHSILAMIQEYKLDKILKNLNFNEKEIIYAKMLITARLVHPGSERETVRWINENSALCELLKTNSKVYDNALHRTAALLIKNHEEIENHLAKNAREIFNLDETIFLYDLTNTYFEGSKKDSQIAKPGKSKERRNSSPLVTLALTVDADGFPKQSKIFKGNIGEPKTLKDILDQLSDKEKSFGLEKTIVIDAGIASEKNIEIIKEKQFKYVAVSRKKSFPENFWLDCEEKELKLSDKNNSLEVKLTKKDGEAWLHCHSKFKEAKEKAIINKKFDHFEQELIKIQKNLTKKGTRKKYEYISEKIGRLKEKYGVGSLYNIEIQKLDEKVISLEFNQNPKGKSKQQDAGNYILRTNRLDLNEEEISKIHRSLTIVENSFRAMKSHLGLRPIHHKNDNMTKAHLFISVLAYHILAGILKRLHQNDIHHNWGTIRNILSSHIRVTTSFKTKDQAVINVRNSTAPTIKQQEIYEALKVKFQPLKSVSVKIPLEKSVVRKNIT